MGLLSEADAQVFREERRRHVKEIIYDLEEKIRLLSPPRDDEAFDLRRKLKTTIEILKKYYLHE